MYMCKAVIFNTRYGSLPACFSPIGLSRCLIIYRHKGILGARPRGTDNQLFAFIPDEGKWIGIEQTSDFRVHEHARYAIVRFSYTRFLPGFGDALTKVYNCTVAGYWPPEQEAEDILIHGVGTRIIRVVFWNRVRVAI